jgi:hypothetical protein
MAFLTPTAVAKISIATLLNNLCMAGLVYKDYSKEFAKVGSSIKVRKPSTFSAVEFDGDLAGEWQTAAETYVTVSMDTLLVVPIEVTSQQMTLDVVDFNTQVIEPAMQELAQHIDLKLCQLYKDIPYFFDSTTPVIADVLGARRIQNDLKVPFAGKRYGVLSPMTTAALLGLDAFRDLDKTGDTKPLRDASLGHIFGYDWYENQNICQHVRGSTDGLGDLAAEALVGATTLDVHALGTGTINKGTILTIESNTGQYVVTADGTIVSNEIAALAIYPALNATCAAAKVVTFHGPAATDELSTSRDNLMFHQNAFAMVSAPLEPPQGGAVGASASYGGLTLNVVKDYDIDKFTNKMTISILCGFKTLTPELAVRFWDSA